MDDRPRSLLFPAAAALLTAAWQAVVVFWFSAPSGVFTKYLVLAEQVLAGSADPEVVLDVSPLYLWLHVALRTLTPHPVPWVLGAQMAMLGLSAGLLTSTVARESGSRWAAVLLVLFNLSPGVLIYGRALEPEVLLLLCISGLLAFAARRSTRGQLAAGLCLAASLWTRPSLLLLLLALPVVALLQQPAARARRRALLALAAPPLAALLALWVRNAALAGYLSTSVMNPGTVAFEGNNPLSTGQSAAYPPLVDALVADLPPQPDSQHAAYRLVARREAAAPLSREQVNAMWRARAQAFLADHPGQALQRLGQKAWLALHQGRRHDLVLAAIHDEELQRLHLLWLPWSMVTAAALAGAVVLWRRRWRGLLVHAVWAVLLASLLLTYVSERQKVAALPAVLLLAVTACRLAWTQRWRPWRVALVLLPIPVLAWPSDWVRDEQAVLLAQARVLDAQPEYMRAVDRADLAQLQALAASIAWHAPWTLRGLRPPGLPWDTAAVARRALARGDAEAARPTPAQRLHRAQLALAADQPARAETELRALVDPPRRFSRGALQSGLPTFYLVRSLAQQGRGEAAREVLVAALRAHPGEPWLLAEQVALSGDAQALAALERYFGPLDARWLAGQALLAHAQFGRAATQLAALVHLLPEFRDGWLALAQAQAGVGDDERAMAALLRALQLRPQPLPDDRWVLPLLQRWAATGPDPSRRAYLKGAILRLLGHLEEARRAQWRALDSSGDPGAVQRELQAIAELQRRLAAHPPARPGT